MRAVGVIGAGQMGAGIAQVSAGAGYHVYLSDIDLAKAESGKASIAKALEKLVAKDRMGQDEADILLSRIQPAGSYEPMADAGLIIEAATEREEIKRKIFGEVGKILGHQAVLASNTSSIPITRLAQASPDPTRFIGVHFFNPVPVMGLIEVIRGLATSDATVDVVRQYGEALGKQLVFATDAPGFIVNRVLMPMINEACFALGEGCGECSRYRRRVPVGSQPPDGTADAG